MDFFTAIRDRRSIYGINSEQVVSDEIVQEVLIDAIKYTPTAFNSQSGRVILLLNEHHQKLWEITKNTLRQVVPSDAFSKTEEKITSFQNGYGTVLFFEDQKVVQELQEQFPLYKDNFPIWSMESSGILQYLVWTGLHIEGYGVSLQHYNPLIDQIVSETWEIPKNWKLSAQMPFGKPTLPPFEKQFQSLAGRFKIYQ